MKRILIILLLLVPIAYAKPWYYNSEYLIINSEISSVSTIVPLDLDYSVDYVLVDMSFFPKDSWNQKVMDIDVSPEPKKVGDTLQFRWQSPEEKDLKFEIRSEVRINNKIKAVKTRVKFPLENIPEEFLIYTRPSKTIDSDNEDIVKLANELAEGENDEFVVVYNLAEWTKDNIDYDLSTLTAEITQGASWVLKNREGVCDELTTLFIALNRALGIPARFISGISYTNALDVSNQWGPHGWAEVYFPGYGWIPFDVTYREFGFVDPTHLRMKESVDGDEVSTKYQWLGKDVDLETRKLNMKTELVEAIGEIEPLVSLGLDAVKDNVGFNSYNLIEASIKNLEDYYISTELYFSKSRELDIIGRERKHVLLKPNEEKKIYWIVKLDAPLSANYIYTFPLAVYSLRNASAETSFGSRSNNAVFSEYEIRETLKELQEEEEKVYSSSVDLDCDAVDAFYYYDEGVKTSCTIKNSGNIYLEELAVCLEGECEIFDLGISQERIVEFPIEVSKVGKTELKITAKNNAISKAAYLEIDVLDEPKIEISDIEHPESLEFGEPYSVGFKLNKVSYSVPKNLVITLDQSGILNGWEMNELNADKPFVVNLPGKDFSSKRNKFSIIVEYEDNNGKKYEGKKQFYITLTNVSLAQRFVMLMNKIEGWLERLFR